MATFIALLIPVTIQHNAMWKQPIALRQRKLFEHKFVYFVSCFVVVVVLVLVFFWGGGGQGVGVRFVLFCFLWGARIQRNAMLMQSIWLRSAIVGREIWSQVVCLFCFFVVCFFGFILFLLFFRGRGLVELFWGWWTGYRLSQLCSEHCFTENFSAISFSICFAFCCGLVCLVCLFF